MLTLTAHELSGLTGRTQPAAQIRWLKARGWIYEIGGDSLPKVASAYFERRMVLGENAPPAEAGADAMRDWHVNTEALRPKSKN